LSARRRRSIVKKLVLLTAAAGLVAGATPFMSASAAANKGDGKFELCNEADIPLVAKFDYGSNKNESKKAKNESKRNNNNNAFQLEGGVSNGNRGQNNNNENNNNVEGKPPPGGQNGGGQAKEKIAQDSGIIKEGKCTGVETLVGLKNEAKAKIYGIGEDGKLIDIGDAPFVNNELTVTATGTKEALTIVKGKTGEVGTGKPEKTTKEVLKALTAFEKAEKAEEKAKLKAEAKAKLEAKKLEAAKAEAAKADVVDPDNPFAAIDAKTKSATKSDTAKADTDVAAPAKVADDD